MKRRVSGNVIPEREAAGWELLIHRTFWRLPLSGCKQSGDSVIVKNEVNLILFMIRLSRVEPREENSSLTAYLLWGTLYNENYIFYYTKTSGRMHQDTFVVFVLLRKFRQVIRWIQWKIVMNWQMVWRFHVWGYGTYKAAEGNNESIIKTAIEAG